MTPSHFVMVTMLWVVCMTAATISVKTLLELLIVSVMWIYMSGGIFDAADRLYGGKL